MENRQKITKNTVNTEKERSMDKVAELAKKYNVTPYEINSLIEYHLHNTPVTAVAWELLKLKGLVDPDGNIPQDVQHELDH